VAYGQCKLSKRRMSDLKERNKKFIMLNENASYILKLHFTTVHLFLFEESIYQVSSKEI